MESSNQLGNRRSARNDVGGRTMPAGTYVHIGIGAANRDPAQFPDPDRLDIRRHPIGILPSAPASTPAPACRSPAWRRRSRSQN